MIAAIRVYNATYYTGGPDAAEVIDVADSWQQLMPSWGNSVAEVQRNWYETHSERLLEVNSLDEISA